MDLGGGWVVDLVTPPNELPHSTLVVGSECPWGLVIPEDPSNPEVIWLAAGTACAFACPFKIGYTEKERSDYITAKQAYTVFTTIMSSMCLVNLYLIPNAKRNPFVAAYICFVTVYLYLSLPMDAGHDGMVCSSNASWLNSRYDHLALSGYCSFIAAFFTLIYHLYSWSMFCIFVELWLRVVWAVKNEMTFYRYFYVFGGLGVTLVLFIISITLGTSPSYNSPGNNNTSCAWNSGSYIDDFYANTVPHIVIFVVSMALAAHGVYECVMISLKAQNSKEKNPLLKIWKTYRMLFLLVVMFIFVNVPVLFWFFYYISFLQIPAVIAATTEWIVCEVSHFVDSSSPVFEICGRVPTARIEMGQIFMYFAIMWMQGILLFLITLTPDARLFWWHFMPSCFRKVMAGSDKTAPSTFAESMSMSRKSSAALSSEHKNSVAEKGGDDSDNDSDNDGKEQNKRAMPPLSGAGQLVVSDNKQQQQPSSSLLSNKRSADESKDPDIEKA